MIHMELSSQAVDRQGDQRRIVQEEDKKADCVEECFGME